MMAQPKQCLAILVCVWCLILVSLAQHKHPDLYKLLDIPRNASTSEVKRAYKKAALKYHPDKLGLDATEADIEQFKDKFHQATTAYDILRDPRLRRLYDRGELDPSTPTKRRDDTNEDDSMLQRYFSRPFALFARTRRAKFSIELKKGLAQKSSDLDIAIQMRITLAERMRKSRKIERKVKFEKRTRCSHCQGSGFVADRPASCREHEHQTQRTCSMCGGKGWSLHLYTSAEGTYEHMENTTCKACQGSGLLHAKKCPICAGAGTIVVEEELGVEFNIAGSPPARRVIQNAGHQGADGQQGNLQITFAFESHPNFTVEASQLRHTHTVSLLAIVEGFQHTIELPTGETVKISHRGGHTRTFERVIPGKGIVNKKGKRGSLVVRVEPSFAMPLTESESQRLLKLLGVNDASGIDQLRSLLSEQLRESTYKINSEDVVFLHKNRDIQKQPHQDD